MKIKKTATLAFANFDLEVAEHAEKIRQWLAHMKRVAADKAKGDAVPPIERHQPYDRPRAPELIELAIDDAGNVAYELEDDSHVLLRQQKDSLIAQVGELEAAAINAIVPPGRRRLLNLREGKIAAADIERINLFTEKRRKPGLLKKLTGAADEAEKADMTAAVAAALEQRPAEDTRHLAAQEERRVRIRAIEEIAAQATHDIEDLTADTIGSWKAPDFSGV